MENFFDKTKFFEKLLILTWIIFFLICLGLLSITSKAASGSTSLPVSPDYANTSLTQEELIDLLSACDTQYGKDFTSGNYFTMFGDYRIFGRYNNIVELQVFVFKIPDTYSSFSDSITENNYNSFIWSNISGGIICNFDCIRYALKLENGSWTPYGFAYSTANIKDMTEPVENAYFIYKAQIVSYSTTSVYVNSSSNKKVITLGSDEIISGIATPPDPFNSPEYEVGDTPPTTVPPSYTYNTYNWYTYNPPSIDNSTIESLLESLIDSVGYLGEYLTDNLQQEFSTLYGNLSGFFQYIGKTIQYYGNLIVDNIQNGLKTFYNNMVSLFEPIFQTLQDLKEDFVEFADLFIHPFDEEEFEDQLANSNFLNAYNELKDNSEILHDIFDNAEERDHFSLYISFENPLDTSVHRIIQSEISFDWLVPLRSVYRPFLWVCIGIELFVGSARVLGNVIGGKAK